MARAIWSGVITFGLVTVPVGLFTATEDHTLHFHQLQRGTSDRVRNRRVNERTAGPRQEGVVRKTPTYSRAGTDKNELRQLSKAELYQRATEQNVTGRSKMSRSQLIDSLAGAGRRRKKTAA